MRQFPIPSFNLFRKDRLSGRGGGVSINVNNEFPINIRNDICNQSFECLWLTLRPKWLPRSVPRIAVACVYLPPSIAPDTLGNLYDYFQSCYDILTIENSDTTVTVAGDFNPTGNGFNPKILTKHCDLKQIIKKTARNANILDFVKILKIFAGFFAIPLVDSFNESFRSRTFPNIWKNFGVSVILKVTRV